MVETGPDMSQPVPESLRNRPASEAVGLHPASTEALAKRTALDRQMLEDRARGEREATRVSAGLKEEKPMFIAEEPPSSEEVVVGGLAGLAAGKVIDTVVVQTPTWIGKKLSGIFTAIENAGYNALKKHADVLQWVPFVGPWLLKKPEKSWEEKEEEEAKKKEQEEKKKKKEGEKVDKLKAKGLSEDLAKALIEGTAAEEEKEDEKKEEGGGETKEEKKAA